MIRGPVVALIASLASPAAAAEFRLEVGGTPALDVRGECRVVTDAGETERADFRAWSPKVYLVDGVAVSCTVQKMDPFGRLEVKLLSDHAPIAEADTAASFNWVRVRSDGPWGRALGLRGHQPLILFGPGPEGARPPPVVGGPGVR